jgi:hypothetical protein
MLPFRTSGLLTALALCVGLLSQGQTAPAGNTITIRMYDARSGRQLKPDNLLVRLNHQDDIHNETLHIDDDGTGQVTIPAGSEFLAVEGTFDNSMEIYINCDTGKEKDDRRMHWYSISNILSTGVIAPNECFNGKYERPRVAVKPGEFLFYVRQRNWRDPSTY